MKSWDIVGYAYQADIYCPDHIVGALPTGEGGAYDGWKLADGVTMTAEANLDEIAAAFQIDRQDERSYDSGDFPKVIFADQVENSTSDICCVCHEPLIESDEPDTIPVTIERHVNVVTAVWTDASDHLVQRKFQLYTIEEIQELLTHELGACTFTIENRI